MTDKKRVIINTRPADRAKPLSVGLTAANFEVVMLPLLALKPRTIQAHDHRLMDRWQQGEYAVTVVVSPMAAKLGLAYWQHQWLLAATKADVTYRDDFKTVELLPLIQMPQASSFVAVGEATASVLRQRGLMVNQPDQSNNEGMLRLPSIAELGAGDRVLVWRGSGGRRLLIDTLRQRRVQVDTIAWYDRVWPPKSQLQYQRWLANYLQHCPNMTWSQRPIVLISSRAAFEHWQHLVSDSEMITGFDRPQLADFIYIVLGDRLARLLRDYQLDYEQVASLNPDELCQAALRC